MILDELSRLSLYRRAFPGMENAIAFVASHDLNSLPAGRYELEDGDYLMVQSLTLKAVEHTRWEDHQQYVDLQLCLGGSETIGYYPRNLLQGWESYDRQTDAAFATDPAQGIPLVLQPGLWAIFLPGDAHRPGQGEDGAAVHKIVFKLKAP